MAVNPANWRSLDTEYDQVLIRWPPDADGYEWFHATLVFQGAGGHWAGFDHIWEPMDVVLGDMIAWRPQGRNATFPADLIAAGNLIVIDSDEQDAEYWPALERVVQHARFVGIPTVELREPVRRVWVVVDARYEEQFGQEVAAGPLLGAQTIGDYGVAMINRKEMYIKRVSVPDLLTELAVFKGAAEGDIRLNGKVDTSKSTRAQSFERVHEGMQEHEAHEHWNEDAEEYGPRAASDYIAASIKNGGDPLSFDTAWRQELSLGEHARARHEHQFLAECLQEAALIDRRNVRNLKVAEKIVRRLRWLGRQQRREELVASKTKWYHSTLRGEHGGLKTPGFDKHIASKEREEAKRLKGEAAYSEAMAKQDEKRKAAAKNSGAQGSGD